MRAILLPVILLSLTMMACSESNPPPEPDPALVELYCDLALLAGDTGTPPSDSIRAAVFERHGMTRQEFEAALQPYFDDPRGWVQFFGAVSDTLERLTGERPAPSSAILPE